MVTVGQVWRASTGTNWLVVTVDGEYVEVLRLGTSDAYRWHQSSLNNPHNTLVRHPNARFWVWECDGWVKLTLKPGQTLRYCYGGPHEEGYSYSEQEFEYDVDEMVVISRYTNNSRDCDGPLDYSSESHCRIGELSMVQPPGPEESGGEWFPWRPNWQRGAVSQRDHYAEAMGY